MGSGYKAFTAGSVLTASDVNNYLMEQSIMYFATTAARDTAITAPEDGMVCYVGSNDVHEGLFTYNGSAWRKGPGWNAPWGLPGGTTNRVALTTSSAQVTSQTNLTGTDLVFDAVANRVYRYTVQSHILFESVNDTARVRIRNSAGTNLSGITLLPKGASTSFADGFHMSYYEVMASTDSQTRRLSLQRDTGTGGWVQLFADSERPILFMVEDVGPSGAPV